MRLARVLLAAFLLAAVVTACTQSGAGVSSGSPSPSAPVVTPAGSASASAAVVSASAAPSAGTGGSPSLSPDHDAMTLGLAQGGTTVTVPIGARVLVMLGTELIWTVTVEDTQVLAPVRGVTLVRGAQGLYVGLRAGRTTMSAIGDAACRSSTPPCMVPSFHWSVTIVVE